MKRFSAVLFFSAMFFVSCGQNGTLHKTQKDDKSLLWRISGNGLEKPSYLFGTIHMLCKEDAVLSNNFKQAILDAEAIYLEVDMDDLAEIFSAMLAMKMKGDTTIKELLNKDDYELVKKYFTDNNSMIPFSMLETFKPIMASALLAKESMVCDEMSAMEEVIMKEAKKNNKEIKGLETMTFQASLLDKVPYKVQAEQLVKYIQSKDKAGEADEFKKMMDAYKEQNLAKLEALITSADAGMAGFTDILVYQRNQNWLKKLKTLLGSKTLVFAVGAGHLPGKEGVINLLRQSGYLVEPVENKITAIAREI